MKYTERRPLLLQLFVYLYFLDVIGTFIFYAIEPSGQIAEIFFKVFGNISFLFLFLSFFILVISQFILFPLRRLFIFLCLWILSQPLIQFAISVEALKYIDIFEYQIFYPKAPHYIDTPTTFWLKGFAIFHLLLAIFVYYLLSTQKAINKFGQFYPLVFVRKNNIVLAFFHLLSVLLILLFLFFSFSQILFKNFVSNSTAGFLHLEGEKLISTAKYYQNEAKGVNVYLIPMMHIAHSNFYQEILKQKYPQGTISLAEGVSDEKKLLKSRGYDELAQVFNLVSQHHFFKLKDSGVKVIPADVDTSSFHQTTIEEISKVFNSDFYYDLSSIIDEQMRDRTFFTNILYNLKIDLIDNRNAHLLNELKRMEKKHGDIIIPWGALHMRGIESAIVQRGYKQFEEKSFVIVNLRKMILKAMERW